MMMNFKEEAALLRSERAALVEAEKAAAREVLRDQFAMAALTGLSWMTQDDDPVEPIAALAYALADAMLAARGGK